MKPAPTKVRTYLPMIRRNDDGTWHVPGDETTSASDAVDILVEWPTNDWRIICLDVDGHISDVTEDALTERNNLRHGLNLFPTVEQREWAAESQAAEDEEWDQAIRQEYRALQRQHL